MATATKHVSKCGEKEKQTVSRNIPRKPADNCSEKIVSVPPGEKPPQPAVRLKSSLIDSRDYHSFCRRMGNTVEYFRPYFQPDELSIPEEIKRLNRKIDAAVMDLNMFDNGYRPEGVWEDVEVFLKLLETGLYHVKCATAELRHYIPARPGSGHLRNSSLESLESVVSEQEAASHSLKVGVQSGYEVMQQRFNDYVKLVKDGIYGEVPEISSSSLNGMTAATQMMSILNALVEFETLSHGLDKKQFTLVINQKLLKERQHAIIDMFLALCRHLMILQETLFLMEHLFVKGAPSIKKLQSMAVMMKKCWREAFVVMDRMIQTCPMFTEVAQEYYGRTLWHAASLLATMQDVDDLQQFLENGKAISYDEEVIHDMTQSQLWLLSCVEQMLKMTSRLTRRMKHRANTSMNPPAKLPPLVHDLKKVMYDLVMMTIGRSSWLNSYGDRSSMALLNVLRDQGARTIAFTYEYNKSHISPQCDQDSTVEDMSFYSGMVCATNLLRNGVLQLHSLIQHPESIAEEPEGDEIIEDTTEEDSGNIKFHTIPGIHRLHTKISIKPYPVSLEGSIEYDGLSLPRESEPKKVIRGTSLKSPWETESEEAQPLSPFGHGPPVSPALPIRASTSGSIDMPTGFCDVESSGEFDSDIMMVKGPRREFRDFSVIIPSKSPSHMTADRSPFEAQQPPEPPSAVSGWDSAPLDKTKKSSDILSVVSSGQSKDVLAVDLIPGPIIGKGSEGHVLKMSYHTTPVAVKIMNHTSLRTRERFKKETKILSKLSPHQNIVNFVGRCKDLKAGEQNNTADLVMVMEYCELGNLYKIISEASYIRELQAIGRDLTEFKEEFGYLLYSEWGRRLQVACDVAAGVAHMHENDIVHRDLTSYNIVLKKGPNGSWISKICDFERSRHIPTNETIPRSSMIANSPGWSAPEVLREDPYSVQADVFSLGVILWELWSLEEPWKHDQDIRNPMMIIPLVGNGARLKIPAIPDNCLPHLYDLKALIEACWNDDPSQRPTMHQAHQKLLEMKDKLAH